MGNNAMYKVGLKKFSIPAWSPDMNPSENVFNYVSTKLYEESLNRNMNFENFNKYSACVRKTLLFLNIFIYICIYGLCMPFLKNALYIYKTKRQNIVYIIF